MHVSACHMAGRNHMVGGRGCKKRPYRGSADGQRRRAACNLPGPTAEASMQPAMSRSKGQAGAGQSARRCSMRRHARRTPAMHSTGTQLPSQHTQRPRTAAPPGLPPGWPAGLHLLCPAPACTRRASDAKRWSRSKATTGRHAAFRARMTLTGDVAVLPVSSHEPARRGRRAHQQSAQEAQQGVRGQACGEQRPRPLQHLCGRGS